MQTLKCVGPKFGQNLTYTPSIFFTCYIVGTINPSEFLQSCRDPEFLHNIDLFTILKLFGALTHFIHRTKATRKVHPM
jgi:hypothetical protein